MLMLCFHDVDNLLNTNLSQSVNFSLWARLSTTLPEFGVIPDILQQLNRNPQQEK